MVSGRRNAIETMPVSIKYTIVSLLWVICLTIPFFLFYFGCTFSAGLAVVNDKVYAVGGFNGSLRVKTVDLYDPTTDTWSCATSMEARRSTLGTDQLIIYFIWANVIFMNFFLFNRCCCAESFDLCGWWFRWRHRYCIVNKFTVKMKPEEINQIAIFEEYPKNGES